MGSVMGTRIRRLPLRSAEVLRTVLSGSQRRKNLPMILTALGVLMSQAAAAADWVDLGVIAGHDVKYYADRSSLRYEGKLLRLWVKSIDPPPALPKGCRWKDYERYFSIDCDDPLSKPMLPRGPDGLPQFPRRGEIVELQSYALDCDSRSYAITATAGNSVPKFEWSFQEVTPDSLSEALYDLLCRPSRSEPRPAPAAPKNSPKPPAKEVSGESRSLN